MVLSRVGRSSAALLLLLLGGSSAACLMTADGTLWQRRDAARVDQQAEAPRDQPAAERRDRGGAEQRDVSGRGDLRDGSARDRAPRDLSPRDLSPRDLSPRDLSPRDLSPPKPDHACGQQKLQLAGPADDGETSGSTWLVGGEGAGEIWMGYWSGAAEWGYFRFSVAQPLPKGAAILSATLSLQGRGSVQWNVSSHALEIFLEDSADAPQVTGASQPFDPGGRPVIPGGARWPATGPLIWKVGQANVSPDLAPLLQPLVQKVALAAGAHVQLWIRGLQTVDADLSTFDYAATGYTASPTTLTISYCQ